MQISTTFRHMNASDNLKNLIGDKISKLTRHIKGNIEADVVFADENNLKLCDVTVSTSSGHQYKGMDKNESMEIAIGNVISKIERQAEKDKGRMRSGRHSA